MITNLTDAFSTFTIKNIAYTEKTSDKTEFYNDLTEQLWNICPPIIIIGGTIGK